MQLTELLDYTLGAGINTMSYVIIMKKVFGTKLSNKRLSIYLPLLISSFIIALFNIYNKDLFKPLIVIPIISLSAKYIFDEKYNKTFIMVIFSMIYLLFSELVVALLASLSNYNGSFDNIFGTSMANIIVTLFAYPFICIKPLNKFFNKIVIWVENKKLIGIGILILFFAGALLSRNAVHIKDISEIIINILLTFSFVIIIYYFIKEYKKEKEISDEYNNLFSYLKTYEKELIEKRKIIHDYNNQLVIIKSYCDPKNTKLLDYLSQIIYDQNKILNKSILKSIDKIPLGLRGLINYKISKIEKQLSIKITVEEGIKDITIPNNKDFLKITGILLDNAIEEAIQSKEKKLIISLKFNKETLIIQINNTFCNKPNLNMVYNCGYSTKGKNRGYGLSLVEDIVNINKKIKVAVKIENNQFIATQSLKL